jgi:hypothetical protein
VRDLKWWSISHFGRDIGLSLRDIGAWQAVRVAAGLCRRGDGLHGKHAPDIVGQGMPKCHGARLCLPSDGDFVKAVVADACAHPFDRLATQAIQCLGVFGFHSGTPIENWLAGAAYHRGTERGVDGAASLCHPLEAGLRYIAAIDQNIRDRLAIRRPSRR